jgi:GEVED domain/Ig-like domain CHU_C associated
MIPSSRNQFTIGTKKNLRTQLLRTLLASAFAFLGVASSFSQNAIVGTAFSSGWGSNCPTTTNGGMNYFTAGAGTSYIKTVNSSATGVQYWRFGVDWGGSVYQMMVGTSDLAVTPNNTYTLTAGCGTNGALNYNVPSTAYNYVFKTKDAGTTPTGDFVFFEVQGAVRSVTALSQLPLSTGVVSNVSPTVTATLDGALSAGQAVYLRYTTNAYATSTVVQMTGSGTTYTGNIPGFGSGTVTYYAFTSGTANVASNGSNADLYSINISTTNNYTITAISPIRTITAVTQNPTASQIVPSIGSTPTTVTATTSGILQSTQSIYLRYSTDNFVTSTVTKMSGSGIAVTGQIPSMLSGTVKYYCFSSGNSGVATDGSNAAAVTINTNDNGGSNYTYSYATSYQGQTFFSKPSATDFNSTSSWGVNSDGSGAAPASISSGDNFVIQNNAVMALSGNATVRTLVIGGATTYGTLNLNGANVLTVTIPAQFKSTLTIAALGTFNVSGTSTLNLNGNFVQTSGGIFTQAGTSNINVDGNNNGDVTTSVSSGTVMVSFTTVLANQLSLTGGTFTIVDPNVGTTGNAITATLTVPHNASTAHTFQFGNGTSTDITGAAGFPCSFGNLICGNVLINTMGGYLNNRFVTLGTIGILGNLTINANAEARATAQTAIKGNLVNNGTLATTTGPIYFGDYTNAIVRPTTTAQTVTGSGVYRNNILPVSSSASFTAITFNNTSAAGVSLSGTYLFTNITASDAQTVNTGTVSGTLTFLNGTVNLNGNTFVQGTSTAAVATTAWTAGGFSNGSFKKWLTAATLSATLPSTTVGNFPFYVNGANRNFQIAASTAATAAGSITVTYNDAAGLATVANTDLSGSVAFNRQSNANWVVTTGNNLAGGVFLTNASCEGIATHTAIAGTLYPRLVTSTYIGTHVAPTVTIGNLYTSVANRNAIPNTSFIGATNTFRIGTNTTAFTGNKVFTVASGDWNDPTIWSTNPTLPAATDTVSIMAGHTVTVTAAPALAGILYQTGNSILNVSANSLTITANATAGGAIAYTIGALAQLNISGSGTVNIGATATATRLTGLQNNGAVNVSGATASLVVNGYFINASGSSLTQSNGTISIDQNSAGATVNTASYIIAAGLQIATPNVFLTGGKILIIDQNPNTTTTGCFSYTGGGLVTASTAHTFQFGNGVSTDAGGTTTGGFRFQPASTGNFIFGTMVIDALNNLATITTASTSRVVTSNANFGVTGNLTLTSGEAAFANTLNIMGNISVAAGATLNNVSTVYMGGFLPTNTGGTFTVYPLTTAQAVGGAGFFRNAVASTANFQTLTINNTNAAGVSFLTATSLLSSTNTGTVAGTLTFTNGVINTGGNVFALGISGGGGTLGAMPIYPLTGGFVSGSKFRRYFTAAIVTLGTVSGQFPFISAGLDNRSVFMGSTITPTAGYLQYDYTEVAGNTTGLSIVDGATLTQRTNTNWVGSVGTFATATGQVAIAANGLVSGAASNRIVLAGAAAGGTSAAAGAITYNSNNLVVANKNTATQANMTGTFYIGSTAATIVSNGSGDWNSPGTWVGGSVPSTTCGSASNVVIASGHTVTVSTAVTAAVATCASLTINTNATVNVNSNTLQVGCSGNNASLIANAYGAFNVTGGIVNVNGNVNLVPNSIFSQSAGTITVDGNSGVVGTSVASATPIFWLQTGNIAVTGGNLIISNPHIGTATFDDAFRAAINNGATNCVAFYPPHTLTIGNGSNLIAGGNVINGFVVDGFAGSSRLMFGNFIVNTNSNGTASMTSNRFVAHRNGNQMFLGDVTINSGSRYIPTGTFQNSFTVCFSKNFTNNGEFYHNVAPGGSRVEFSTGVLTGTGNIASPYAQTIGGSGVYGNVPAWTGTTTAVSTASTTITVGSTAGLVPGGILTVSAGTLSTSAITSVASVLTATTFTVSTAVTLAIGATVSTAPDANFSNLAINNNSGDGVTFSNLNSLLSGANASTCRGTFTMSAGTVSTGANTFVLGTGTTLTGAVATINTYLGVLAHTSGGFSNGSTFSRWYANATTASNTIANLSNPSGSSIGKYPFVSGTLDRSFFNNITTAAPTTGGRITVQFNDANTVSTVAFADASPSNVNITRRSDANWVVTTGSGYTPAGTTTYSLAALGTGIFTPRDNNSRLVGASASVPSGLGILSSTTTFVPAGMRTTVAAIAGTYYLGYADTAGAYISVKTGAWEDPTTWDIGAVPGTLNNAIIQAGHTVTVSTGAQVVNNLAINAYGTLSVTGGSLTGNATTTAYGNFTNNGTINVSAGTLNVNAALTNNYNAAPLSFGSVVNVSGGVVNITGTSVGGLTTAAGVLGHVTGFSGAAINLSGGIINLGPQDNSLCNRTFASNGTLNVTGGNLNVAGNVLINSGSFFTQTTGSTIKIDGNAAGVTGNSVSGVPLMQITANYLTLNVTGGSLIFTDPSAGASDRTLAFNNATSGHSFGLAHTTYFGDGSSNDASINPNGFEFDTYVSSASNALGNVVVNGGSGTNRWATGSSTTGDNGDIMGNLTINAGSEFRQIQSTGQYTLIGGNLINNGVFTTNSLGYNPIKFGKINIPSSTVRQFVPQTIPQSISGTGIFRSSASEYASGAGATSAGTTITVGATTNLRIGMQVRVEAGVGAFAPQTYVTSVVNATTFTVSQAPTTALSGGLSVVNAFTGNMSGFDLYNTSSTGLTLQVPLVVNGNATNNVTLFNGKVTTTTTNFLQIGSIAGYNGVNTPFAGALLLNASNSSYINGPLARTILGATAGNTLSLSFPVGKSTYNPVFLNPITSGSATVNANASVVMVEAFDANGGTPDGNTMTTLNAFRRWTVDSLGINGAANITSMGMSAAADNNVTSTSTLGGSTTPTGVYTAQFGSNLYTAANNGSTLSAYLSGGLFAAKDTFFYYRNLGFGVSGPLTVNLITLDQGYSRIPLEVTRGSVNNNGARIGITVAGSSGAITLTDVKVKYTGSALPTAALDSVSIWIGTFTAPTAWIKTGTIISSGGLLDSITWSSLTQNIPSGNNFIWVRFAVNAASGGTYIDSLIDFQINNNSLLFTATGGAVAAAPLPPATIAPSQTIRIGYCLPTTTAACTDNFTMTNIAINTINASLPCASTSGLPNNFIMASNTTTLEQSGTYAASFTVGAGGTQNVGVWVDFNRDGDFQDAGEYFVTASAISASGTGTVSIIVPAGASLGLTRMRVRGFSGTTPVQLDDCTLRANGTAVDFNVTIAAASPQVIGAVTITQVTGGSPQSATNQNAIRFNIPVTGTQGTQTFTDFIAHFNGTLKSDIAASGVKLWKGTSSAPTTQIGTAQSLAAGDSSATFAAFSSLLTTGNNYFWVTYNTSATAVVFDSLDFKILTGSISVTAGGIATAAGTLPVATLDAIGKRFIDYCQPASTLNTTYINSFVTTGGLTNISNTSTGYTTGGYVSYAAQSASQYPGQSFAFTTSMVGMSASGHSIFIDWNNDGDFVDAGEQVNNTNTSAASLAGTITVPSNASYGNKRMRVMVDWQTNFTDACNTAANTRVEAEDYTFLVATPPTCASLMGSFNAADTALSTISSGCQGTTFTLSLKNPIVPIASGITYKWFSSRDTIGAPITAVTVNDSSASSLLTSIPDTGRFYRQVVYCSGTPILTTTWVRVLGYNYLPVSTTGTSRCGTGVTTISAVPQTGDAIRWYAALTGGSPLFTGNSYTTGSLLQSNTQDSIYTFYAADFNGTTSSLGQATDAAGNLSSLGGYGMYLKNLNASAVTINSVKIYPSTAGTLNVTLVNNLSATISTATFTIAAGDISTTVQKTLSLGFTVPAGATGWSINYDLAIYRGGVGTYTYPSSSNSFSITGNTIDGDNIVSGSRYYFYDWSISAGCEGARVAVKDTVKVPAAIVISDSAQFGDRSIGQGVAGTAIASGKLTVSKNPATVSTISFTFPANATFVGATDIDVNGLRLYKNTVNNFGTATLVGSGLSSAFTTGTPETIQFTVNQTWPVGATYYWLAADIAAGATLNDTIIVNGQTAANFTFAGCFAAATGSTTLTGKQVIVSPCSGTPLAPTFASYTTLACTGAAAPAHAGTDNNSNTVAGFSYQWYTHSTPSDTTTSLVAIAGQTGLSYTHANYTTAGNYYYTLKVECFFSGLDAYSYNILDSINTTPTMSISPLTDTICIGASTTLTASGAAGYSWSPGGATSAAITVSPSVTTLYTVTGTTANCSATATRNVVVNALPVLDSVKSSVDTICNGQSLVLTGYSAGGSVVSSLPSYAASNATSTADEEIFNVSLGTSDSLLNNSSTCATTGGGAANGLPASTLSMYSNYSSLTPVPLYPSQVVPVSIGLNTCGGNFTRSVTVYIDYNRNGVFDLPGDSVFTRLSIPAATVNPLTVSGSFTVPNTAVSGKTLMRVVYTEAATTSPTGTYTWGETEDYIVDIQSLSNPALTYTWNTGAVVGNPLTVSPTVSRDYTLTVTNPTTGCSRTAATPKSIVVNPTPTAPTAVSNGSSTCGTPTFTATSTSGFATPIFAFYSGLTGNNLLASGTDSFYTPGSYVIGANTVYVTERTAAGCQSSPRVINTITASTPDTISVVSNTRTVCINSVDSMSIASTYMGNYNTYTWTPITNLYQDSAGTIAYTNGLNLSKVYVKRATAGSQNYVVNCSNVPVTNSCINTRTISVTAINAPVITVQPANKAVCGTGSTSIALTATSTQPLTYAWSMSADGTTGWTPVADATPSGATYTGNATNTLAINTIGTTYYYRATVSDAYCTPTVSIVDTVSAGTPTINSFAGATRCGTGTLNLTAGASAGASVRWFATNVSTAVLGTGTTFTTPTISTTTDFFAEANTNTTLTGLGNTTIPATTGASAQRGIVFTAYGPFTLVSAQFYTTILNTSGTYTAVLQDASGVQVATTGAVAITTGASAGFNTMNLNFAVPAAGSYRLLCTFGTISVSRHAAGTADFTNSAFNNLGTAGIITSGYDGAIVVDGYSYFHNITAIAPCISASRQQVTATVTAAPAITAAASDTTLCKGADTTNLSVTSSNAGYSYTWAAAGAGSGLTSPLTGATQNNINPTLANTYTYTVNAVDASGGAYNGCTAVSTRTVVVNALPTLVAATALPTPVCAGLPVTLSAISSDTAILGTDNTTRLSTTGVTYRTGVGNGTTTRTQYLVTASELIAAGMSAGPMTGINFRVFTATGSMDPGMIFKLGNTSATALTTTFDVSALTTVLTTATSYTPVVGNNIHTFTTPFPWNGSSNIIVEVCGTITTGTGCTMETVSTPTITTVQSSAGLCAATTGSTATGRPVMYLYQGTPGSVTFSWTNNVGASISNGQTSSNSPVLVGNSTSPLVYKAHILDTITGCRDSIAAATVTVKPTPRVVISGTTAICPAASTNLNVAFSSGSAPFTFTYTDGTTPVTTTTSSNPFTPTVTPAVTSTYTLNTVSANGCIANVDSVTGSATIQTLTAPPTGYVKMWRGGTIGNLNDWNTATNWCSVGVPATADNVYVPSTPNQPLIAANPAAEIGRLLIQTGAVVTIGTGATLATSDSVNRAGNITGAGSLALNGATGQILTGAGTLPNNVVVNTPGFTATMNSNSIVNGNLNVTPTSNLDVNGNQLTIGGTVTGAGTINATSVSSTVLLTGDSVMTQIPLQLGNTIRNLDINKTAMTLAMNRDLTVTGALNQYAGKVSIGNQTLTLAGSINNSAANSLVGSNQSNLTVTTGTGTAFFDQTTSADTTLVTGSNALNNLTKSGADSFRLGNKVNVFNKLSLTGGMLVTNGKLVLRSTASNTAWVPNVTGGISGLVTVERYMHTGIRGWRGITAPITYSGLTINDSSNTIKKNWQSDFGYAGKYGTIVTHTTNPPVVGSGIDAYSPSANMQYWNPVTQAWIKVSNTYATTNLQANSTASAANIPYFFFIRGDRSVLPNQYAAWVQTTLGAKGLLQTGTQVFTLPASSQLGTTKSWAIGNPYACPVDMDAVAIVGATPYAYVWVPEIPNGITNTTTSGKYVTFDRTSWAAGPSIVCNSNQYLQSGQVLFLAPMSAGATVTFTEANKVTVNSNNVSPSGKANGLADLFNIGLINVDATGTKKVVDGARAKFGDGYDANVDVNDAIKWSTAAVENLSLKRNGSSLVIETRPYIVGTDSLFVNTTNLVVGNNYEFAINPINFDATVSSCILIDNFLNTQTPISLSTISNVPFNVTATTGSNATNRFTIVFNGSGTLPNNNNLTVKAFKKDKTVEVNWEVTAETGMKIYNVEKSVTGNDYKQLGTATAKNGNKANTYSIIDNNPVIGVNYYRVQGVLMNDNSLYSAVVRVEMNSNGIKSVTVYPNPVKGNVIGLQLNNLEQGVYTAKLTTTTGQQVWSNTINHNGNNGSLSLQLNKKVAQGSYQLQLIDAKGNAYSQSVLVVE